MSLNFWYPAAPEKCPYLGDTPFIRPFPFPFPPLSLSLLPVHQLTYVSNSAKKETKIIFGRVKGMCGHNRQDRH